MSGRRYGSTVVPTSPMNEPIRPCHERTRLKIAFVRVSKLCFRIAHSVPHRTVLGATNTPKFSSCFVVLLCFVEFFVGFQFLFLFSFFFLIYVVFGVGWLGLAWLYLVFNWFSIGFYTVFIRFDCDFFFGFYTVFIRFYCGFLFSVFIRFCSVLLWISFYLVQFDFCF